MIRRTAALTTGALVLTASTLAAPSPASAEPAIDGALTSGDTLFPNQGNGGYDVGHYDLDYAWTPGATLAESTIDATASIDATTTGAPLRSFALDFEGPTLDVDSVTVNGAGASDVERIDGEPTSAGDAPELHKLVVTPATPVEGDFDVEVEYSGVPTKHVDQDGSWEGWVPTADGMIFMGQPIGSMTGYPNNNTPADKATYTISLDIPSTITAGGSTGPAAAISNGVLQSRSVSDDGSRTTWVWDQAHPQASELTLVSIGKYDMFESTVALSDGSTIPEYSFIDSAQSSANKSTFTSRRTQLQPITQRLESIYGAYPFDSTGVVVDSVPANVSYALETQDRSFFPSVRSLNGSTLIHELVHQWYGDTVSPKSWQDIWINEGMATWGPTWHNSVLAATVPYPEGVEDTFFEEWDSEPAESAAWDTPPSGQTDTSELYEYQTYDRGAQFYEALRTAIGTDDYLAFVKAWVSEHRDGNGSAADHEALAEEVSGRDLTAFYQDWIYEAGKPAWPGKFDLALTADPASGEVEPGSTIAYDLQVTNTGKVPLEGATVTLDLADVLDDADISGELPDGVTLGEDDVLTWAVPTTPTTVDADTATTSIAVEVDDAASDATLDAEAASDTLGSSCTEATCTTAHSVAAQELSPAPTPTISGTPTVGKPLTAETDGWPAGTAFEYQWAVDGADVDGATDATFTPRPADLGGAVTVEVTGSKEHYTAATRESDPVGPVAKGTFKAPKVSVAGQPVVGNVLRANVGTVPKGATVEYAWLLDGKVRGTERTRALGRALRGQLIRLRVTVSKTGYETEQVLVKLGRVR